MNPATFQQIGHNATDVIAAGSIARLGFRDRLQVLLTGEIAARWRIPVDVVLREGRVRAVAGANAMVRFGTRWPWGRRYEDEGGRVGA